MKTKKHCVYFLKSRNGKILYIGKTSIGMKGRMFQHNHKDINMYSRISRVDFYEFDSKNDADMVEIYLISKYKPIHNVEHADKKTFIEIDESKFDLKVFFENNSYIDHNGKLVTDIKNREFFLYVVEMMIQKGVISMDDIMSFNDRSRTNTTMLDIFYYGINNRPKANKEPEIALNTVYKGADYFKNELYKKYKEMISRAIRVGNGINKNIICDFVLCEVSDSHDLKYSLKEGLVKLCTDKTLQHIHLNQFEKTMISCVNDLLKENNGNNFERHDLMVKLVQPLINCILSDVIVEDQKVA